MPAFHCNARYFLITYSKCGDLSEWSVLDRFVELGAECIIARELHKSGHIHFHVFADFGRKFRSRKTSIFDVDGRHANIEPSWGTPEKGYDYAIKDGDILAGGLERPTGRVGSGAAFHIWTQITDAEDRDEFWSLVQELDPKSLCCSFGQLQKYADWKYTPAPPVYATPGGFEFVGGDLDGRDAWVQAAGRPMSLVLYGETRTGKTLWARSLGRHIYNVGLVSGAECIKAMHDDVKYAIFDDIRGGMKFFPAFKEWLGGQMTVTVKLLYRDPVLVPWGRPTIWISNGDPRLDMEPSDANWLEQNAIFIDVASPIFRANTE
ncbi:replication-associated protein [robinz virus RP_385]|nr:replication-associated protein [robinz virus RP_385]